MTPYLSKKKTNKPGLLSQYTSTHFCSCCKDVVIIWVLHTLTGAHRCVPMLFSPLWQGGLSAAPARAVSAVKNMNLPEIPRNINIGDLNIKVPSLSPFWRAFQRRSAGPVNQTAEAVLLPPSYVVNLDYVLFIFYLLQNHSSSLPTPSFQSYHVLEMSCGLCRVLLSSCCRTLQLNNLHNAVNVWIFKASTATLCIFCSSLGLLDPAVTFCFPNKPDH